MNCMRRRDETGIDGVAYLGSEVEEKNGDLSDTSLAEEIKGLLEGVAPTGLQESTVSPCCSGTNCYLVKFAIHF